MALPFLAPTFPRRMAPRDTLDLYVVITQGPGTRDILEPDESIVAFTVGLPADSAAAGLILVDSGANAPRYGNLVFRFVLKVDPAMRGAAVFEAGVLLGVELTFSTNIADREKRYTVGVRVVNK